MAEESSFLDFVLNESSSHRPFFPPRRRRRGFQLVAEPAGRNCSHSLRLACCIRWAAAVSLSAAATRCRAATVSPGRKYGVGLGNANRVSSGV